MRIITFLILVNIIFLPIKAQIEERVVEGCIMSLNDSDIKKPVLNATVSIFELPDSVFIKGGITDESGRFAIRYEVDKSAKTFLKISHIGLSEKIHILSNLKQENVTISLPKESIILDEVFVVAAKPQIIQKRDTTIINTEAFKIPLNSYLDGFLSRIPGMIYDKQTGILTYNGRQIQAIRLNGKPFFDGDMQTALQRLPTFYIDKINIYQSHSNNNRSENLFVLDLKTKATFNGVYLNSIEGGYGSNDKQCMKIQTDYFQEDGTNLSFYGGRSNKDLHNKYDGNMSHKVGINGYKQVNERFTIAGSINYNHLKNGAYSDKYEEQYLTPNNFYSFTRNTNINKNSNLTYRTFIDWKLNNNTNFLIDVGYDYTKNNSSNDNQTLMLNRYSELLKYDWDGISDSVKINKNDFNMKNENTNHIYQLTGKWMQRITDKVHSELIIDYSNVITEGKDISKSSISYYNIDSLYNNTQYSLTLNRNFDITTSLSLSYEIKKNILFQPYYSISYWKENRTRNVFCLDNKENNYNYIDSLSSNTRSNSIAHNIGLKFKYKSKCWNVESNFQYSPLRRKIDQLYCDYSTDSVISSYDIKYDLISSWTKKNIYLSLYYKGYTNQPELGMMLSVKNTSNPLNVYRGNPFLKRIFLHSLGGSMSGLLGFSSYINFEIKSNDITEHILYNSETGYKEITPTNINGNWNLKSGISWNKTFKLFTLSVNNNIYYNNKVLSICEIPSNIASNSITNDLGLNVKGGISYKPIWGNLDLYGEHSFYRSVNSLEQYKMSIMNYKIGLNGVIDILKNLQLDSNYYYLHRYGNKVDASLKSEMLWDINVIYKPLKKQNLILTFSWIDILSQRKNVVLSSTADKFYEYKTNQIPTFIILSLKYDFELGREKKNN